MTDGQRSIARDEFLADVLNWSAGLSAIAGGVVLALQIYGWLVSGIWTPVLIADGAAFFGVQLYHTWPFEPQGWIGLARIAQWILELPLTLLLILAVPIPLANIGLKCSARAHHARREVQRGR